MKIDDAAGAEFLCRGDHIDGAFDVGSRVFEPIRRVLVGGGGMDDMGRRKIPKRRTQPLAIDDRASTTVMPGCACGNELRWPVAKLSITRTS